MQSTDSDTETKPEGGSCPASGGIARRIVRAGLDLVFPPTCAGCSVDLENHAGGLLVCQECREQLTSIKPGCRLCGADVPAVAAMSADCPACRGRRLRFDTTVRLGPYQGLLRRLVLAAKSRTQQPLAVMLADLMAETRHGQLFELKIDLVVPIPMHWSRRLWRGGNHTDLLAARLAKSMGVAWSNRVLTRTRRTVPQAELPPSARFKNIRGALRVARPAAIAGKRVLVVDDIMTTGATCSEAARVLLQEGASYVASAIVARAEGHW